MADLEKRTIIQRLRSQIEQAITVTDSNNDKRKRAFDQFFLEPNGTESEGRSTIQSADVNSMITAVTAQMVISFSTDSVVDWEANSAEDEQAAAAESRAINKILVEQNGGFLQFIGGVQNALMYRNGYLKVWWAEDIQNFYVTHDNIEQADLPAAVAVDEVGVERRLVSYDASRKRARVEVTKKQSRLMMRPVANERFFIDPDHDELDLGDCPLVGEVHYKTRDQLARMGVKTELIRQLNAVGKNVGQEDQQRRRRATSQGMQDAAVYQMELCRVYEAYAMLSFDADDMRAELYKCWLADTGDFWLLEPELVARRPYAPGTAFPIANSHEGESLAEKLYYVQEGKTELLRQWVDNVRNCSWGMFGAVRGQVDADDLNHRRAGGAIRLKRADALIPIPVVDVGMSIKGALEELDKQRSERGGAAVDMIAAEMQVANDTAHGTERVYASKELLLSYMTRNLAETMLRSAYLLAHAELRDGDGGPINLKIAEAWQEVDPSGWPERTHCNVKVGYSAGERMHMQGIYMQAIQMYLALLQQGMEGQLVTLPGLYRMIVDWMTLGLVDNAEAYFVDPESQPAQEAGQGKAQQAQQQQEMAMRMEVLKGELEKYKTDQETGFKYFDAVLDAMVKAEEAAENGAIQFAQARAEASASQRAGAGGAGGAAGANGAGGAAGGGGKSGNGGAEKTRGRGSAANRGGQ